MFFFLVVGKFPYLLLRILIDFFDISLFGVTLLLAGFITVQKVSITCLFIF